MQKSFLLSIASKQIDYPEMPKKETKKQKYKLRAKIPVIVRYVALLGLIVAIAIIGIGFYTSSGLEEFRLKPGHTQLSKDVVGIVNGYERRESDNGVLKYFITADKATTFADEHQELENVFLQVFDEENEEINDKISAKKAIYIPADDGSKDFTIYFADDVDIKTRHGLNVQTQQLAYDKSTEIADSSELVEFQRENIAGRSFGAVVNIGNKTLDLLKDVEINAYPSESDDILPNSDVKRAKLIAGRAFIEQAKEKIKLEQGVEIYLTPNSSEGELSQPTDIRSARAVAYFRNRQLRDLELMGNVDVHQKATNTNSNWTKTKANRAVAKVDGELKKLELFENVEIQTTANEGKPTKINADKAVYEKELDRFELENNVEIVTVEDAKPTRIKSAKAIYEPANGKVFLTGGAQITQGTDIVRGDIINAELFPDKKLKYAFANGNAFLRQETSDRNTEVNGSELNASFSKDGKIQKANAIGSGDVVVVPKNSGEFTKFAMSAPKSINLDFRADGTLNDLTTNGRTTIKLNSPNNAPDSANKKVTADSINTTFRSNGNELAKAVAKGNAELIIEPLSSSAKNYNSTVRAARFDCEFYEKNNAKNCSSTGRTTVLRVPTVKGRAKQNLEANKLNAIFNKKNQKVERFDAVGKAKFSEGDRTGIANRITFTEGDGYVRLRGNEPTVWDSQARAKAEEIDWDTRNNRSTLGGKVSTTYYSQKNTGGSTPFGDVSSPVFLTAAKASFDHSAKTGLYTGNARAWQDKNYVRAEKLLIEQEAGRMFAEGKVQSMLYDTTRTVRGKRSKTPVYASADKMSYERKSNMIRYENDVDIRQGTDRIVAGIANVYLDSRNQLSQTVVEKNVVITQPKRKASGSYAQYNAKDETVILRGNPAKVSDSESGSSSGREVVMNLRENSVVGKGKTTRNSTGRIRTVYRVKNGKIN